MASVLIVGSNGILVEEVIKKLYKENWRIYTLVSGKKMPKISRAFEQYNFDYDNVCIREIIGSCHPDIILFTGAYDPAFPWNDEHDKESALKYISGLSNLLMCANLGGVRHFIYLSSECVFEDIYANDILEDTLTSPQSAKSITISQGEGIASHFNQTTSVEVTVVRMAGLYGTPRNRSECTDRYSKLCLSAITSGKMYVNIKQIHSALHVSDAAEALFLLMKAEKRNYRLYHVSSEEETSDEEVAQAIQAACTRPVEIVDQTIGLRQRTILSGQRFRDEFGYSVHKSYRQTVPQIISYMQSRKSQFLTWEERLPGDKNRVWRSLYRAAQKIFPFIECIACFVPIFMLNNRSVGSTYFNQVNLYLLYVLLFATVHGRQQAIFASFLSVLGYCFRQMYTQSGFSLLINFNTYIWVAQLFIVGLTVGHIRDHLSELETDKNEEIRFLQGQITDILTINASNTKMKEYFEKKAIGSQESIGQIYSITSQLDEAESSEVLFAAAGILSRIMEATDIAIYFITGGEYCRLAVATSEQARALGKSIAIREYEPLFEPLRRRQIFVNRTLEPSYPMMASALFDSEGAMKILLLLWGIPYERMTLYYANTLTIVGALIYGAMHRAAAYMEALSYKRFLAGTSILQASAFNELLDVYRKAAGKGIAEYCLLSVENGSRSLEEWSRLFQKTLRQTDSVGFYSENRLLILLTNTNVYEASFVIKRLSQAGITARFWAQDDSSSAPLPSGKADAK